VKTRAALFRQPGRPFEVGDIELAEPRAGEVLVRMAAVGICGTDLHMVKGEWQRPTPMVLGHEGSGVVEAVGEGVESLAPGDPVVLSWAPACGECADCRRGRPAACLALQRAIGAGTLLDGTTGMSLDGETVYRGTATGALAERLVVGAGQAMRLGHDLPLEDAALLGCAALTGVGAVLHAARLQAGASALVIGAGGVGQFVVQGARIAGASTILAVDPLEGRREQVLTLGATHAAAPEALKETMKEAAPDGVDYAFDAVGAPETSALALRWTRNGGTAVIVGLPAGGARLELDPAEFNRREKFLTGSMYGSEDPAVALPLLLEHVRAGRLELKPLLGPRFALDQVNEAFEASLAGTPGRVLVTLG
jgi:S-(hydroxymethyl)glutathione dehydrogenase/alcohol dehydrogenase